MNFLFSIEFIKNCLFLNTFILIGLIFSQNDISKDSIFTKNSSLTPLEKATSFSLVVQFLLLFIHAKNFY
jgi:hypothetical protein